MRIEFRPKSRSIQLPVTVQGSDSKFNPLAAKLTDKNMSSISVTRSNQLDLVAVYMVLKGNRVA